LKKNDLKKATLKKVTLKELTVKFNSAKLNRRYFSKPTPYAKPTNAKSTQTYQK